MSRFLFIFLFSMLFSFAQENKPETISWSDEKLLTWEDFKGIPNKNSDAAALTASGITFGFSLNKTGSQITDFNTNVECLFYPHKSWRKKEFANNHILEHEQLHFNITELHARKFRHKINEIKVSQRLKSQLNGLYKSINQASYNMQRLYDKETNHSINKEKQAEWQKYISSELEKLEAFKTQ